VTALSEVQLHRKKRCEHDAKQRGKKKELRGKLQNSAVKQTSDVEGSVGEGGGPGRRGGKKQNRASGARQFRGKKDQEKRIKTVQMEGSDYTLGSKEPR